MEQVSSFATEHVPVRVSEILFRMGVGADAVEWARPFGTDLRAMWEACEHGELMIGIACNVLVPSPLTTLALVESLVWVVPDDVDEIDEVDDMVDAINLILVGDGEPEELEGRLHEALGGLDVAIRHFFMEKNRVAAFVARAAHSLGMGIVHAENPEVRRMLCTNAVKECAKVRMEVALASGESDAIVTGVGLSALRDCARIVRHFVPFEIIAMSCFYSAFPYGDDWSTEIVL